MSILKRVASPVQKLKARIARIEQRLKGLIDSNSIDSPTFVVDETNHRVGIGTTGPAGLLEQFASGANLNSYITVDSATATQRPAVFLRHRGASAGTTPASSRLGLIAFEGQNTGGGIFDGAYIESDVTGTVGANGAGSNLFFGTNDGSSAGATERMRIDSSGNVGIGDTTPDTNLEVNGAITLPEMTAPAAPAANKAVLFVRDNGSGKTQLCVQWSDSTIVALATQG